MPAGLRQHPITRLIMPLSGMISCMQQTFKTSHFQQWRLSLMICGSYRKAARYCRCQRHITGGFL